MAIPTDAAQAYNGSGYNSLRSADDAFEAVRGAAFNWEGC